jgi:N-acetylglucosamine malate deacetylase 1
MIFDNIDTALVIAAHPDDEVLGVGGTVARMAAESIDVHVVYVTTGVLMPHADPEMHRDDINAEADQLEAEASDAAETLGAASATFLGLPDSRLDTVSRIDVTQALREATEHMSPDIVFTHHPGDYKWDHRVVFDASMMAFRANAGSDFPRAIFTYEVPSATERSFQTPEFVFCPNLFVDVTASLPIKLDALNCYDSRIRDYPHPRSKRAVEVWARKRGNEVGVDCAEAFTLVRGILT